MEARLHRWMEATADPFEYGKRGPRGFIEIQRVRGNRHVMRILGVPDGWVSRTDGWVSLQSRVSFRTLGVPAEPVGVLQNWMMTMGIPDGWVGVPNEWVMGVPGRMGDNPALQEGNNGRTSGAPDGSERLYRIAIA